MAATLNSTTGSRFITLEGGLNFRDIGGYRAGDATVRWGRVYRAGVLCYFTDTDHSTIGDLRIRTICDLRRDEERAREPTHWPNSTAEALAWEDGPDMPTIRRFAASRPKTAAGMRDSMFDLYRALPTWMAPRIRGFLECIADERVPVVVHCAAGKDRTGVAIAVLLATLGVDEETILDDYLLTNSVSNFEQFIQARTHSHLGLADKHEPLLAMPAEMREVLFRADADYLHAALAQIRAEFGDVDSYLKACVRLDDRTIAQVRDVLLE